MSTIIGQFEGKCADAEVVNANGMEIGRDVWETIFASEDYKTALARGHYIGYLGHPEDPGCQEFQNACIILRECHIEDNGEVFGKFDLIDTPVGRTVKAFIDAGVQFGISVRGAGDVVGGVVEADTFVFRGFDLVAFPAYDDAVPTFTEIAASSDVETQRKYKKVCAAVNSNLPKIKASNSLNVIQSMFSAKSDVYRNIEKQKERIDASKHSDISSQKIEATTMLYVKSLDDIANLKSENASLRQKLEASRRTSDNYKRRIDSMNRIVSSQINIYKKQSDDYKSTLDQYKRDIQTHKKSAERYKVQASKNLNQSDQISEDFNKLQMKYNALVSANTKLKEDNQSLYDSNLYFKQKINSSKEEINDKDSVIASLKDKLSQTVTAAKSTERKVSNRDSQMKELQSDLDKTIALVEQYQDAFASLYASAVGVRADSIAITSSTTVEELKQLIDGSTSTCNIAAVPDMHIDQIVDDESVDDGDLITV